MLLSRLFDSTDLKQESQVDQLALLVALRWEVSAKNGLSVCEDDVLKRLVLHLKALLTWLSRGPRAPDASTAQNMYFFELEVGWIAANVIASSQNATTHLFFDSGRVSVPVIEFLRRSLASNVPAKLQNALYLLANSIAESELVC